MNLKVTKKMLQNNHITESKQEKIKKFHSRPRTHTWEQLPYTAVI
jgi:hypothetical protein